MMKTVLATAVLVLLCLFTVHARKPKPVAYVHGDVMTWQPHWDNQGPRSFIVVQMKYGYTPICATGNNAKQYGMPFYKSTGANSGLPETWFPVIGFSCGLLQGQIRPGFVLKYVFADNKDFNDYHYGIDVIDKVYEAVGPQADALQTAWEATYNLPHEANGKKLISELMQRTLYGTTNTMVAIEAKDTKAANQALLEISCGLGSPLWSSDLGGALIRALGLKCDVGSIALPPTEVWPFRYDGADLMAAIGDNNIIGKPYVAVDPGTGEPTLTDDGWYLIGAKKDKDKCNVPMPIDQRCLPPTAQDKTQWEQQYDQKVLAAHGQRSTQDLAVIQTLTRKAELPSPGEQIDEFVKKKFSQCKKIAEKLGKLKASLASVLAPNDLPDNC